MNFSSFYISKTSFSAIKILLLLFCCLNYISHTNASTHTFFKCLSTKKIPKSLIYTTKTPNFTNIFYTYVRNRRFYESRKPVVILTPYRESQVSKMVKCAKRTMLQLRIRSGGHDYEGLSYTTRGPFAILDMFNLRSIEIDVANETAWVQSGATLGELYYRISQKSKTLAFPAGVCPTVGVGGHFSGGGYGTMLRKHGIAADHITDARVVDARGRILDRRAMGEDLFWAIRGGGAASFCVVLSYKVNLVRVPPVVTVFNIMKTARENATAILHRWQYVAGEIDRDLFIRVNLKNFGGKVKRVVAGFFGMYLGDSGKLAGIMRAQFPELGLTKGLCYEMSWIESVLYYYSSPPGSPVTNLLNRQMPLYTQKIKSDYVTAPLPLSVIEGLFRRVQSSRDTFQLKFNPYGGRMAEIPATATPFPHRAGNIYKIQYFVYWFVQDAAVEAQLIKEAREYYDYMKPFVSRNPRRAFLNYRDIDVGSSNNSENAYNEGKIYGVRYFGENFDRLVRVKTAVDPTNFFRNEQSIPPLLQ